MHIAQFYFAIFTFLPRPLSQILTRTLPAHHNGHSPRPLSISLMSSHHSDSIIYRDLGDWENSQIDAEAEATFLHWTFLCSSYHFDQCYAGCARTWRHSKARSHKP